MKNTRLQSQLIQEIDEFLHSRQSLLLSTLDTDNYPHASYAPFTIYNNGIFIFISRLAAHTQHLLSQPKASVLLIEDENVCEDVFARKRLTYQMFVNAIERESLLWSQAIDSMTERLGERVTLLSQLDDFVLFQLLPKSGRYVKGFGKAYELHGDNLSINNLQHISGPKKA